MFIATTISFVDILDYNTTNNIGLDLEGDYCFDSEYYGCGYWVATTESDLLDTVSKDLIKYVYEHFDDGRELDEHKITIYVYDLNGDTKPYSIDIEPILDTYRDNKKEL